MIGDASFIGLDCPSGNVDDCNDRTKETVQSECSGILIVPDEQSQCGSKCSLNQIVTRSEEFKVLETVEKTADFARYWTFYTS